jgi:hypothetical protein
LYYKTQIIHVSSHEGVAVFVYFMFEKIHVLFLVKITWVFGHPFNLTYLPKNVGNRLLLTGSHLCLVWSSGYNGTRLPVCGFVINGGSKKIFLSQ